MQHYFIFYIGRNNYEIKNNNRTVPTVPIPLSHIYFLLQQLHYSFFALVGPGQDHLAGLNNNTLDANFTMGYNSISRIRLIELCGGTMQISSKVFSILKERGISQKEFSKMTGIAESTICDWKRKGFNPSAGRISTICVSVGGF